MWNIDNQPVFTCLNCSDAQFCYFVNFGFNFGSVVESAEVLRRSCNLHYPFGVATQLQSVATHRINRCNMTKKTMDTSQIRSIFRWTCLLKSHMKNMSVLWDFPPNEWPAVGRVVTTNPGLGSLMEDLAPTLLPEGGVVVTNLKM